MPEIIYTLKIDNSPASAEVLEAITELQVENNAEMADVFRIRMAIAMSDKEDWTVLENDIFQPMTPVTIEIQVGTGKGEILINGFVTSQRVEFTAEPGGSFLEVVGMDATAKMNLEEKIVAWPNMSDSDIAQAIFGDYQLQPDVVSTQPSRTDTDTTTIQRGTDIQFLRRLARRNGFECYVECDPSTKSDTGHFHPPKLDDKEQGTLSVSFSENTNVKSFSIRYDMLQPVTAKASGVEIESVSSQNGQAESISWDNIGSKNVLSCLEKPAVILAERSGLNDGGELQTLCQAIVDRSGWAIVAEGSLNASVYEGILRPHRTVNVRGTGQQYSGLYYVSRVLHTFTGKEYEEQFELRRNAIGLAGSENFVDDGSLP